MHANKQIMFDYFQKFNDSTYTNSSYITIAGVFPNVDIHIQVMEKGMFENLQVTVRPNSFSVRVVEMYG